jgi:hypothetical protein
MDGKTARFRIPECQRTSFWADVEVELARIEPHELALFERADRGAPCTELERELWEHLKLLFPA